MYAVKSENLTEASDMRHGGQVSTNWVKYHKKLNNAKTACEKDYGQPIKWAANRRKTKFSSGDLGHVMYIITLVKTED